MGNSTPGMELRELLARTLFQERFRLRVWDHTKDNTWVKKDSYRRADEAIRRAGLKNVKIRVPLQLTENVR